MYYSYDGLERFLSAKRMTKTALATELGISSKTMAKMSRGEKIANHVLKRIADYFSCSVTELCAEKTNNLLLQTLRDEKDAKISGGLYHELQVRMTYNSNHIEGSKLSEDQTRLIFETRTINATGGVPVDDIIETVNHFRAIDYVIDVAEDELTEEIIKELHRILKQGTADASLSWFAVGDYKKRANMVGGRETAKPKDVPARMKALLSSYSAVDVITVDDIIETVNHFRAIDYVIDVAEDELTEEIIKELHRILKQGTADASLSWFAVGDYKKRANVVGGRETAKPKDVPARMKALLAAYDPKSVEDIIAFHHDFESIHPFQDGNGRVGRLIALKECLHYGIVPFIIEDSKKAFYYRGLSEWENEKGYLIDTCLDGQDTFRRLLALFDIDV